MPTEIQIPSVLITALQVLLAFGGAFFLALWISLIIWTFRDARQRSRDVFAILLATLMVTIFGPLGLLLYFLLRPPTTLAELYERSLEEEALLQDLEERPLCPGCSRQIKEAWIVCPDCHTSLKKNCPACGQTLDLTWNICPFCATLIPDGHHHHPAPQPALTHPGEGAAVTQVTSTAPAPTPDPEPTEAPAPAEDTAAATSTRPVQAQADADAEAVEGDLVDDEPPETSPPQTNASRPPMGDKTRPTVPETGRV